MDTLEAGCQTVIDPIGIGRPEFRDYRLIGGGGFSTVYSAFQDHFNRHVAIKLMQTALHGDQERNRFARECRIAGLVSSHPNIVTLLDAGLTEDSCPYIVFEFMAGGTLADRVHQAGPMNLRDVLRFGVRLCGALATVHGSGILHRDVKPMNVLFSDFDEPCLADFGISGINAGDSAMTETNSFTPLYSAPEIIDGHPASAASDIYSLGATLYYALTGRPPFETNPGESMRQTLDRIASGPAPSLERADTPDQLRHALRYAMATDPADRYEAAEGFGHSLQLVENRLAFPMTEMIIRRKTVEASVPSKRQPFSPAQADLTQSFGPGRRGEPPVGAQPDQLPTIRRDKAPAEPSNRTAATLRRDAGPASSPAPTARGPEGAPEDAGKP